MLSCPGLASLSMEKKWFRSYQNVSLSVSLIIYCVYREALSYPDRNPETCNILVKWFVHRCSQGEPEWSREWGRESRKPAKAALSNKIPQKLISG